MGDRIQILLSRIDHKKIDQIIYSISASSLDQLITYFKNNSKKLSDVEKATRLSNTANRNRKKNIII